jgi:drug/metabolite transporter (DMT)-like permease
MMATMTSAVTVRRDHTRAVLLFTGQVAVASLFQAVVKGLAGGLSPIEILFFRCLFGLAALLPVLWWRGGHRLPMTARPLPHLLRGVAALGSILASFTALSLLPLAMSTVLDFTVPLFLAMAGPLAGQRLQARGWLWVLLGFAGCVVLAAPDGSASTAGLLAGLAGSAMAALCTIQLLRLPPEDGAGMAVLSLTAVCTVGGGVALLVVPGAWTTPDSAGWAGLVALGVMGTLMQLAATRAYLLAPPTLVAPLDYLRLPIAVAIGYAVWGDMPDAGHLAGAALIIAGSFGILRLGRG